MTATTMSVIMLAMKMAVAGSASMAIIIGVNWFNNFDPKAKKKGGVEIDSEGSDIRQKLRERN